MHASHRGHASVGRSRELCGSLPSLLGYCPANVYAKKGGEMTVGIFAYGSLIEDRGPELEEAITEWRHNIIGPFGIEFARTSITRGGGPTLVPYENGGPRPLGKVMVLNLTEQEAANRLWWRETRKIGTGEIYRAAKNITMNTVVVERLENFGGVDVCLYTSIASNIEDLTPQNLARLAIASVPKSAPNMDGVSYLLSAKTQKIRTALSDDYEAEILVQVGVETLVDAIKSLRAGA